MFETWTMWSGHEHDLSQVIKSSRKALVDWLLVLNIESISALFHHF